MRRNYLVTAVFSLPLVNAFSLANFQPITSGLIPIDCALSYNTEIPSCDRDDFNNGCSKKCRKSLRKTGGEVQNACFGLIVNSRSLLGIVQAGGIVDALCVTRDPDDYASTTPRPTTTTPPVQTTRPVVTSTFQTTVRTTTSRSPIPSSTLQTSIQPIDSSTTSQSNFAPSTTLAPTDELGPISSSSSSSAASTTTSGADAGSGSDGSGGGSPFDIVSGSGGGHIERSSIISALVLGGWALMIFGR